MVAIWWAWIDTAWITNWLDPRRPAVRMLLFALMLGGLVMSSSIPRAFEDRALAIRAGLCRRCTITRNLFMLWSRQAPRPPATTATSSASRPGTRPAAPFWILGCFVDEPIKPSRSLGARGRHRVASPRSLGFWVPGLGPVDDRGLGRRRRSYGRTLRPVRHHCARRVDPDHRRVLRRSRLEPQTVAAFVVSFVGSVAMWTVYFNIGAERSSHAIATSDDPRRARAQRLYLPAYPDRRRHHRRCGRR